MTLTAARFKSDRRGALSVDELAGAVAILRRLDRAMQFARYDYGSGQRDHERRSFEYALRWHPDAAARAGAASRGFLDARDLATVLVDELERDRPGYLLEVFDAIATPRLRRRGHTYGGWLRVLHELLELEKAGGRDELELRHVDVDDELESWLLERGLR